MKRILRAVGGALFERMPAPDGTVVTGYKTRSMAGSGPRHNPPPQPGPLNPPPDPEPPRTPEPGPFPYRNCTDLRQLVGAGA